MHMLIWVLHIQLEVFNGTMHTLVMALHTQLEVFNSTIYMLKGTYHTQLDVFDVTMHMLIWMLRNILQDVCNGIMNKMLIGA